MLHRGIRCRFLTVLFVVPAACHRYELVPDYMTPACQNVAPPPRSGPPILVTIVEGDTAASVRGRVMSALAPPAGLGQTIVIIRANDWRADTTDSFGQFDFSHVRPGTYEFVARRVGYQATRDSIAVPERGGLSLTVQLAQSVYDGACSGYAGLMVRKPWWKFW